MPSVNAATAFLCSVTLGATASRTTSAAVAIAATLTIAAGLPLRMVSKVVFNSEFTLLAFPAHRVTAETLFSASFGIKACGDRGRDAIGLCEVMAEVLNLWGFTNTRGAPGYAIARALNDINAALQTVWNQSDNRDYWARETLTLALPSGVSFIDLPDSIQNVTGNCRLKDSRRTMTPLGTLSELEIFTDIYLDGAYVSEPVAYHIERKAQEGRDPVKTIFHVTPPPDTATEFLIEVVKEAPRYGLRHLADCPRIPIPHRYVESLLLPIARYRASSYYLFDDAPKKAAIDMEYQEARIALGMADPLPGDAGDNNPVRKEGRA